MAGFMFLRYSYANSFIKTRIMHRAILHHLITFLCSLQIKLFFTTGMMKIKRADHIDLSIIFFSTMH